MTPDEIAKLIPDEVVEAAARAAHNQWRHECAVEAEEPVENWREWDELDKWEQDSFRAQARAAFVAMVEAWPGMDTIMLPRMMQPGHFVPQDYIRLPLMENPDDKA